MYDLIVIGGGPAGISAAIYAKRANLNVLVLYTMESQLLKAHKIDNYYGFVNGISGQELYNNGIGQAQNLGVHLVNEEVTDIAGGDGEFVVKTFTNEYQAKSVVIATGNKKIKPDIKGIDEYEGRGISYCAICDGFFYRNKKIAVIGNGRYAISEANDLKNIAAEITILTNGEKMAEDSGYIVKTAKISEISGDDGRVSKVIFEDNTELPVDGIFIAIGQAGGGDFAKKLGILMENGNIQTDENMETNIKGIYVCGNLAGGLLQVNKAAYEGAVAGLAAVKYVKSSK